MRLSLAVLASPLAAAALWSARQDTPPQTPPEAPPEAPAAPEPAVRFDEAHVVAAGLEGSWEPEPALWERMTGRVIPHSLPAVDARLRIVRDEGALAALVPEVRVALAERDVLLAGWVHDFGPAPAPFVLTAERGAARLTWYQPNGDGAADPESREVELALASKPEGDLLFLGPAAPSRVEPFKPYRRARELTYADRMGRAKVVLVQLENAAIAYAADHDMTFPERLEDLIPEGELRGKYLPYDAVPKDPWGNAFGYAAPAAADGRPLPTFTCFGSDGKPAGEGEARDFDNHMIRAGEI